MASSDLHSSPVRQISLIAQVELKRLLTQSKGVMTLVAYVMLWLLLLLFVIRDAVSFMQQPSVHDMVLQIFGEGTLSSLFKWQVPEYAMYWVFAIMLQPMFAILLSAGQFADDIQRGTFRFLSLHCSRTILFFGRFVGALLVMALLSSATVLVTMVMAIARDSQLTSAAISSGIAMWFVLMAVLLPYIAIMSLFSVIAVSSKQAITYAVLYFTGLSILVWLAKFAFPPLAYLDYMIPGAFSDELYGLTPTKALAHLGWPIVQSCVLLALGFYAFKRSDV